MNTALIGLIRTGTGAAVGALVTWLVTLGVTLPEETAGQLTLGLFALATAGYTALVNWAAARWPAVGWLLGYPSAPTYEPRHSS